MTNEEAIKLIEYLKEEIVDLSDNEIQAFDLAIKALEQKLAIQKAAQDMVEDIKSRGSKK